MSDAYSPSASSWTGAKSGDSEVWEAEEELLNSTFEACDSDNTGCVSAVQIVGYLRGVTGQPQDDGPLRRLCRLLDPQETGRGLPRERFLSVMRAWVQECRQKGSEADEGDVGFIETISLLQPGRLIEGDVSPWESRGGEGHRGNGEEVEVIVQTLQEAHRRLSERNAALQRAIEAGEEERGREREERQALRVKLRDSQHALQQAQTLREELEDLKNIVRGHEERERDGERKKKTLEREIQTLTAQLNDLQLENESLLTEREELREREAELSREREGLLVLLEETQRELACRDALLSQDGRERDRLQENEEEYCATIAELKAEIASLREKLGPGGGGGLETSVVCRTALVRERAPVRWCSGRPRVSALRDRESAAGHCLWIRSGMGWSPGPRGDGPSRRNGGRQGASPDRVCQSTVPAGGASGPGSPCRPRRGRRALENGLVCLCDALSLLLRAVLHDAARIRPISGSAVLCRTPVEPHVQRPVTPNRPETLAPSPTLTLRRS
ncbi:protein KASH5-like isoform X3 [Lepisosteus oculatus]|uniref:protein KASH5-like isoform X3 n=1 Tax=Lepisosteus oculatus TaxID=7918 RepID=UPI003718CE59